MPKVICLAHFKLNRTHKLGRVTIRKEALKRLANVFFSPQSHVWLCFLFFSCDRCHKKLIELSAQGVRGQTHPVRSSPVVSHREGWGGCDLLIVRGMMDWERREVGRGKAAVCGSHKLWRESVATRGDSGWLDNSVTTWHSFLKLGGGKEEAEKEKERGKICPAGCRSSKNILVQRLSQTSFRAIWKYISES